MIDIKERFTAKFSYYNKKAKKSFSLCKPFGHSGYEDLPVYKKKSGSLFLE